MKKIKQFKHQKVLVLGLAKSGVSAALLLHKLGAFVTVNDYKPFDENPEAQGLLQQGIKVICGSHPIDLLDDGFMLIVKNPGIPYSNPLISEAVKRNIPVMTEVELSYLISDADIIGITGTNGKTTTTTLLFEMLQTDNKNPLIAGNIGVPASKVAEVATIENTIVMELSSFQLMGIQTFRPKIAIITNLYEAHLDYHGSRAAYVTAKINITKEQTAEDYLIVNADQAELIALTKSSKAKIIPFSTTRYIENGCSIQSNHIVYLGERIIDCNEIMLPGAHNLENCLTAVTAAKIKGVSNDAICHVLKTFSGVKHRTQFVKEIAGRRFYNDSKATNTLAAKSALKAFDEPTILIAGGLDRGIEFEDLIPAFKNVKALITFGESASKLEDAGKRAGIKDIKRVEHVGKAVPVAFDLSNSGDVILLSPACASWDQYKTFEVRGDIFIDAVHMLT